MNNHTTNIPELTEQEESKLRYFMQRAIVDEKEGKYHSEQLQYANCKALWSYVTKDPQKKLAKMLFLITKWFFLYTDDELPKIDDADTLTFEKLVELSTNYNEKVLPLFQQVKHGNYHRGDNQSGREVYAEPTMAEIILEILEQQSEDLAVFSLQMLLYNNIPVDYSAEQPRRLIGHETNIVPYVAAMPKNLLLEEKDVEDMILSDSKLQDTLAEMQGIFKAQFGTSSNSAVAHALMETYLNNCRENGDAPDIVSKKRICLQYYYNIFQQEDFRREMSEAKKVLFNMTKQEAKEQFSAELAQTAQDAVEEKIADIVANKDFSAVDSGVVQKAVNDIGAQVQAEVKNLAGREAIKTSMAVSLYSAVNTPHEAQVVESLKAYAESSPQVKEIFEELHGEVEAYKKKLADEKPKQKKQKGGI